MVSFKRDKKKNKISIYIEKGNELAKLDTQSYYRKILQEPLTRHDIIQVNFSLELILLSIVL